MGDGKKYIKLKDVLEVLDNDIQFVDPSISDEAFMEISIEGEFDWKRYTLFSDKLLNANIEWIESGDDIIKIHLAKGWCDNV